jgi:hypothetical protein
MEFISGESHNQILLLPDSIDDYVKDNNSVRVFWSIYGPLIFLGGIG